ncbi:Gldg family protein [Pseudomonas sp. B22129]|uniref:Gldg family protein n=1 Tax=Pseudomonas sp. B22129 TaxID=3235111 RepID=UPI0037835429
MRSTLLTGMTLIVMSLLFLAFNLVWINSLPDVRWDFSAHKKYTLSLPARQLLKVMDGPLDLYYFNSRNSPKRSQAMKRYGEHVEDMLKEYEKAAKGMINLHIVDPAPFSEDAYKAGLFGLDDKQGFLGLIGTRAGQVTQRIDVFNPEQEDVLEYQISHLIYKLVHPQAPTVGLLSGLALDKPASLLLEQLHQHFNVVDLKPDIEQIPGSIGTLMVVHPHALPERALYAIEQFVLRGAKLMVFIDPMSEMAANTGPMDSKLDGLLTAWGIQMPNDQLLVDSLYATSASFGPGKPAVVHPARLNLPRQAMAANDISTWALNSVLVSSSGALSRIRKSRTVLTPLLFSSKQSALLDAGQFASATAVDSLIKEVSAPAQPYLIAARLEGPAYSAFPGGIPGQPPGLQKAANIQVVVVADTDLLADAVIRSAPNDNALFVLNTLDNLAAPEVLANVRALPITDQSLHPLEQMREAAAQAYAQKAGERQRQLQQTEQEWQRLPPRNTGVVTQTVDTSTQLQALNKERLRLPMELQALKVEAFAQVHRAERNLKLLMTLPVPLLLCLIAWRLFLNQRRRRAAFASAFH